MLWSNKYMHDRFDQIEYYSDAEYKRRHDLARKVMADNGYDLLLVVDAARESHDSWFTGRKFVDTVIVPKEGDIIAVLHREFDERDFAANTEQADYTRYVKQLPPYVPRPGVRFINHPGAAGIASIIASYTPKTIGLVNSRVLSHALSEALKTALPDAEIIDAKQVFDSARAVKSDEEWDTMRLAARGLEQLADAMRFYLRPGVTTDEVTAKCRAVMLENGAHSDLHIMVINCGPQDQPAPEHGPQNAAIPALQKGDRVMTILESNSYGGHQLAMGRQYVLGPASDSFKQSVAYAAELNQFAASQMKPGNTLGNIKRATEEKALADGTHLRRMCWMHGLSTNGYYEQFSLNDYGMEWPLTDGAVVHCHPVHFRKFPALGDGVEEEVMLLNTYGITKDGGKSIINLDQYPFDLVEIDC